MSCFIWSLYTGLTVHVIMYASKFSYISALSAIVISTQEDKVPVTTPPIGWYPAFINILISMFTDLAIFRYFLLFFVVAQNIRYKYSLEQPKQVHIIYVLRMYTPVNSSSTTGMHNLGLGVLN